METNEIAEMTEQGTTKSRLDELKSEIIESGPHPNSAYLPVGGVVFVYREQKGDTVVVESLLLNRKGETLISFGTIELKPGTKITINGFEDAKMLFSFGAEK